MKKYAFLFLIIVGFQNIQFAQSFVWGKAYKCKGYLTKTIPSASSNFLLTETGFYTVAITNLKLDISSIVNSSMSGTKVDKVKEPIGFGVDYAKSLVINGSPMVFRYDKKANHKIVYCQKHTAIMTTLGDTVNVSVSDNDGTFVIEPSQDKSMFVVVSSSTDNETQNLKLNYRIFDENFNIVSEGAYLTKHGRNKSRIRTVELSNSGTLHVLNEVYEISEKSNLGYRILRNNMARPYDKTIEKLEMYEFDEQEVKIVPVDIPSYLLDEVVLEQVENGNVVLSGIYSKYGQGHLGVFSISFNFKSLGIMHEKWNPFSFEMVAKKWSNYKKKKGLKLIEKGKYALKLSGFIIHKISVLGDGSIVGIIEKRTAPIVGYTNPGHDINHGPDSRLGIPGTPTGLTTGSTHTPSQGVRSDELIVFSMNSEGDLIWQVKIDKKQDDKKGFLANGSLMSYIRDEKLHIIFNDLKVFYKPGNKQKFHKRSFRSDVTKEKRNRIIPVEVLIDLSNGKMTRKPWLFANELKGRLMPAFCCNDEDKREMVIVELIGQKYRFGVMKY
jgi:hypothetical protein